ncbi:hypothetical protein ACIRRH_36990 [Kitasatospora sp. NPDC101235]
MRSTPRRIARFLVAYAGAVLQVLVLGCPNGPGLSRKPPAPGA